MPSLPIPPRQAYHERQRRGFTIIESLVLLAILAVLTMILIALARKNFIEPDSADPAPSSVSAPAPAAAAAGEENDEPAKPEPTAP